MKGMKMKILLIGEEEDAKELKSTLRRILEPIHDIFTVDLRGVEDAVHKQNPDLVVFEGKVTNRLLKILKHMKTAAASMQVLILADPSDKNYKDIIEQGADGLLIKPFKEMELLAMINAAMETRTKVKALLENKRITSEDVELFHNLLDSSPDWECLLDTQGHYSYVSPSCAEVTGYQAKEFMEDPGLLEDITCSEDLPLLQEHLAWAQSSVEQSKIEFRVKHRNGEVRWISHVCQPFYNKAGKLLGRRVSNRDITEHKQMAIALQENEAAIRRITDNMTDLISETDAYGVFCYVSPSYQQVLGYSQEELLGKSAFELIHPEDAPEMRAVFQEGVEKKAGATAVYRFRHAEGYYLWVETIGKIMLDDGDHVTGAVFASRDITKRRLAEEERNRLFNLSLDMLCIADLDGYLLELNPTWEKTLGWKQEELLSRPYLEFVHPDDRKTTAAAANGLVEGQPAINFVNRYRCKDGSYRWLSWKSLPLVEEKKVYCVVRDITETRKTEEALQKAHAQMEQKVKERTAELTRVNQELTDEMAARSQADTALRESEEHFRLITENMNDVVWLFSADSKRTLYISPSYEQVWGLSCQELYENPQAFLQAVHPDDLDAVQSAYEEYSVTGVLNLIYGIMRPDGAVRWVNAQAWPAKNELGVIIGHLGRAVDITELKLEEAKLKEVNETLMYKDQQLSSIIETQQEMICRFLPDTTLTFVNQAYCRAFGLTEEALLGKKFLELLPAEHSSAITEGLSELSAENLTRTIIHDLVLPNGSRVWQEWTDYAILNAQNEVIEFQAIGRDITQQKQAEKEIRDQRDELDMLYSFSTGMRAAKSIKELYSQVITESCRLMQADGGMIVLLSRDETHFTITAGNGCFINSVDQTFPVGQGLSSRVLKTREPIISENYSAETQAIPLEDVDEIGPTVLVPLQSEEALIGVLAISRLRGINIPPFTSAEADTLLAIGEIAGNALRRQLLFDNVEKHLKQIQALRNIDMAITGSLDLRVTFNVILDEITRLLGTDGAAILRLEPYTMLLKYEAWRGFRYANPKELFLRLGEGLAGRVAMERNSIHIPDILEIDQDLRQSSLLEKEGFASYHAVPLIAKGHVQGVLEIYHRKPFNSSGEWLDFFETLAGQTAIAIDNAELFHGMEKTNFELIQAYDSTIEGWAHALDLKNEETEEHSRRVTDMTLFIAREMNIKEEDLIHVKRGALLHDIGKMGIPDEILLKPGQLNDEEWEIMRRHPVYAYQMLASIDYLRPALDIPYCHHEKWDGSGYPRGLKGNEIPLPARIFAVVDVYDALTSDRPYRRAWSREKALEHILQESGKHFDPQVVNIFLREMK